MPDSAIVYFVDVAQGTSQVVLFPDSSIVIVDCGESSDALIKLLESLEFDRIRALVLSHWHSDHVGGAIAVLKAYVDLIEYVFFAQDQAATDVLADSVFQYIHRVSKNQTKFSMEVLQYRGSVDGKLLPLGNNADDAFLMVLYPDGVESLKSQKQQDQNQGSGVLMLCCGDRRILFPADAGKKAFKAIHKRLGNDQPMRFDVIAAPHHSGKLCNGSDDFTGYKDCFDWLYTEIIKADHVVVSVGTGSKKKGNKHDHPRPAHLKAAVKNQARIICTQITNQCHPDPYSLGPSVLDNCSPHSSCCLESGDKGIGCAGTVQVNVSPDTAKVLRIDEHQKAIDEKLDPNCALCRKLPTEIAAEAAAQA